MKDLQEELEKHPERQEEWQVGAITLDSFLTYILTTLNCHPLYSFCNWRHSPSSVRNRTNISLTTNRLGDHNRQLAFKFSEKVMQILQNSSPTIDPIKGLLKVNTTQRISFEYPSTFPAFLETTLITHSLLGPDIRRVLKTIPVYKEKHDKVTYSEYFSNIEYHPCEKHASITAIRMSMVDKYGSNIQFKSGEMTVTLHCKKKTDQD